MELNFTEIEALDKVRGVLGDAKNSAAIGYIVEAMGGEIEIPTKELKVKRNLVVWVDGNVIKMKIMPT